MQISEACDDDFAALLAGVPPRELSLPDGGGEDHQILSMLRDLAAGIKPAFSPASWMLIDGREIVGLCSIVKLPASDGIDIGYGVAATRRSRGFATAGVGCLLDWARTDNRVSVVRAETSIENLPSQRVLERNRFRRIGHRIDEQDGELICWSVSVK
jgi:RimJ/RimL family protein N-acetyltransferase